MSLTFDRLPFLHPGSPGYDYFDLADNSPFPRERIPEVCELIDAASREVCICSDDLDCALADADKYADEAYTVQRGQLDEDARRKLLSAIQDAEDALVRGRGKVVALRETMDRIDGMEVEGVSDALLDLEEFITLHERYFNEVEALLPELSSYANAMTEDVDDFVKIVEERWI